MAPANDRPNVLLIMTDQQKASSLSCYGNEVTRTPALDRLAHEGVVVDGGICNYPACTPARSVVHTGRYAHTTRVRANHIHMSPREISLPLMLKRAGYENVLIGKNHIFPDGGAGSVFRDGALALRDWPHSTKQVRDIRDELEAEGSLVDMRSELFDVFFGADHFAPQGPDFTELRKYAMQPHLWLNAAGSGSIPFPPEQTTSTVLGAKASAFVRERASSERPWFMWLSFPDPHNPYIAPEPYASMYDPSKVDLPPVDPMQDKPERQQIAVRMCGMHNASEDVVRRAVALQYGQVTAIDDAIGSVLRALGDTDATQRTLVLFMTDHGGYVGDHGAWHKAPAFYDCLIRIPMLFSWPGTLAPRRLSDGFVEEADLMPTLLEACGVTTPPGVQGRSMLAALAGNGSARDAGFSEVGEAGDPVTWDDLPFMPDDPLDQRYYPWDGYQETWVGQGKMVRTATHKYCWWANGEEELYDLGADPDELTNLAGRVEEAPRVRELRDRVLRWCVESEDQLPVHAGNIYLSDAATGNLPF